MDLLLSRCSPFQDWIRKTEETTKLEKFCREDQNENCRKRAKNPRKCKGNAKVRELLSKFLFFS